jgi:hypothetical protein
MFEEENEKETETLIIDKKYINPIIIPLTCFKDNFDKMNSLFSMNPSLFITKYGDVYILIRNINYRKFQDKQFTIYGNNSSSTYFLLKGCINENLPLNLDLFTYTSVNINYNKNTYNTYWRGIEDIRFINEDTLLAIVPELNINGNPSIFKSSFSSINYEIHSFIECYPNYTEKNWMPYIDNDNKQKVVYCLYPFKIKSIVENDLKEICVLEDLKNYHGSSNGILYKGNYILFLIHSNKEKVYSAFILFDPVINDIILSKPFLFFKYSYIEFTCSLSIYNERIFVSLGVNDSSAYIVELEKKAIDNLFIII